MSLSSGLAPGYPYLIGPIMNAKVSAGWSTVHQYIHFYYLANELAYMALKQDRDHTACGYATGTVILVIQRLKPTSIISCTRKSIGCVPSMMK